MSDNTPVRRAAIGATAFVAIEQEYSQRQTKAR